MAGPDRKIRRQHHHTVTHELGHVYSLSPVTTATPGPLGMAHLYFHDLISPRGLGGSRCRANELYADALSILVHGEGIVDETNYWGECEAITSTVSAEALAVVRSAVAGDTPSWFDDTYDDSKWRPGTGAGLGRCEGHTRVGLRGPGGRRLPAAQFLRRLLQQHECDRIGGGEPDHAQPLEGRRLRARGP